MGACCMVLALSMYKLVCSSVLASIWWIVDERDPVLPWYSHVPCTRLASDRRCDAPVGVARLGNSFKASMFEFS